MRKGWTGVLAERTAFGLAEKEDLYGLEGLFVLNALAGELLVDEIGSLLRFALALETSLPVLGRLAGGRGEGEGEGVDIRCDCHGGGGKKQKKGFVLAWSSRPPNRELMGMHFRSISLGN